MGKVKHLDITIDQPYCRGYLPWSIDSVGTSIQQKLVRFEKLTHARAIHILRNIKGEVDVRVLLCHRVVHVPVLWVVLVYASAWTKKLRVSHMTVWVLLAVPTVALAAWVGSYINNASLAYRQKSKEAADYFHILDNSEVKLKIRIQAATRGSAGATE